MKLITFLIANWDSVLVVIGFIAFILILIKKGETKILMQILDGLVTKAEKKLGVGTGSLKYSLVADWLYQRIPAILKPLFTAKDIEKMIEEALPLAKEKWEKNHKISNFISQPETNTTEDIKTAITSIAEVAAKTVVESVSNTDAQ